MKRIILLVMAAMVMTVLGSGIAAAAPVNNKNAEFFQLTCSNGQEYTVVVTNGLPGHIVGSNSKIIPVEITFTAIDPETEEPLFSETNTLGQGKKVGLQGDLITCEIAPQTFVDPETDEEITFVISLEAFLTPRGR
jgi:hypothetical protein